MNTEERLGQIVREVESAGLQVLVIGGHAVRYYGVGRNTVDFDLYTAAPSIQDLRRRLSQTQLLRNLPEGPSWRPADFARFELGQLPGGREEWLEFWLHNHLLPEFSGLRARQEIGPYGGQLLSFISLSDLLRSKETERDGDWQDIALLEEIRDARNLASGDAQLALRELRSHRGFKMAFEGGLFEDRDVVRAAAQQATHPVSIAFLLPKVRDLQIASNASLDPAYAKTLRSAELGDSKHLGMVEVVRRTYRRRAMELDRMDKQSRLTK